MAIASVDGILAGMQAARPFAKAVTPTLVAGRPHSLWALAGMPGAGGFDTTLAGVALSSSSAQVAGQIPHTDPGAGNAYLARLQASATQPGTLLLCDRLWHNGGMDRTSTGAQTINSAAFPARDAAASSNGDGVLIGMEVSVAMGTGTPTITLGYTNESNASGKTATNIDTVVASSAAGAFYRLGLAAGDKGVRSIQNVTFSATWGTSGTLNLVAYRVLAALELTGAHVPNAIEGIAGGFPRLPNGAVPFLLFIPSTTTASNISGSYVETQG